MEINASNRLKITKEDIINGILCKNAFYGSDYKEELHDNIIQAINADKYTIDNNNDIYVLGHWITLDLTISQFNKNMEFCINFNYKVHKTSKYSDVVLELNR